MPLFLGIPSNSDHRVPSGGYTPQPGSYWKNCQMGHELRLDFKPRTAIKSQALVDFMAEWRENQIPAPSNKAEHWTLYFDGSLKIDGGGTGVLFISPSGKQLIYDLQIMFEVSNNKVEY